MFVHYVCIFCLYIFYLCRFIFLILWLHSTLCLCMCLCARRVCSFCSTLYRFFAISIYSFGCYLCVRRFIIGNLKIFTFSLKNSCTSGKKYQTNIIKLELFVSNFNPLNLNLCQVLCPILLKSWGWWFVFRIQMWTLALTIPF